MGLDLDLASCLKFKNALKLPIKSRPKQIHFYFIQIQSVPKLCKNFDSFFSLIYKTP